MPDLAELDLAAANISAADGRLQLNEFLQSVSNPIVYAAGDATTIGEIDAAFATFVRERPDALFVSPNGFFNSRRVQIASLAAREDSDVLFGP